MMNQTYYDYQIKPIIRESEENPYCAKMQIRGTTEEHQTKWLDISTDQLKAILHILNTTI